MNSKKNLYRYCSLCHEMICNKSEELVFDCTHILCLKCFPYIAINILSNSQFILEWDILQSFNCEYFCPLCEKGKISMNSFENLSNFLQMQLINPCSPNRVPFCDLCHQNKATKYCQECEEKANEGVICDVCCKALHSVGIKQKHKLSPLGKYPIEQQQHRCLCNQKKRIKVFCENCKIFICNECRNHFHSGHDSKEFDQIKDKFNDIYLKCLDKWIKSFIKLFSSQKEIMLNRLKQVIVEKQQPFIKEIEKLISALVSLKKNCFVLASKEALQFKKQINLINTSIKLFSEKITSTSTNFNEKYQILKNFSFQKNPLLGINIESLQNLGLENYFDGIKEIEKKCFEKIANNNYDNVKLFKEISSNLDYFVNLPEENFSNYNQTEFFSSDPIELLKNYPYDIEKMSFNYNFAKSSCSTSFKINGESFIAWPNYETEVSSGKTYYPVIIYNLSKNQRDASINYSTNRINFLSTFPTYINEAKSKNKWLYSADERGTVKFFDLKLNTQKKFPEVHSIVTSFDSINSVVVFQDEFNEIIYNLTEKKNIFAVISFVDRKELFMYKFINNDLKSFWQKFREINNPVNKFCWTMNYFYDQAISKTYLFFGFSRSYVKLYKLKENSWNPAIQFPTQNGSVSSINFIFVNEKIQSEFNSCISKIKKYIIFTEYYSNFICVGNIDSGEIVKQIQIPGFTTIFSLMVWNSINDKNYLIAASYKYQNNIHNGSIDIISFDDMLIKYTKLLPDNIFPVNFIKSKISFVLNNQINEKETLVVFHNNRERSSINQYLNDPHSGKCQIY